MQAATQDTVDAALKRLDWYRVRRAQTAAAEGEPDGISGALLLALGMRETWGRNVEGGAKMVDGRWVALDPRNPDEAKRMDVGWLQISRTYHRAALERMPGVKAGTWEPVVPGANPYLGGYVPRFEESLQFTIREMREAQSYGFDHGVRSADLPRFAVAAHNAGVGGALSGYKAGNVDRYTTGGDYSGWVLATRTLVNRFLSKHPNWKVTP